MDIKNGVKKNTTGQDKLPELEELLTQNVDVIQSLRADNNQRNKDYSDLKAKYEELKKDFVYNLQLIQQRDEELNKYDKMRHEHNIKIAQKDVEISDLKVKIDELKIAITNQLKAREESELHYQQRIQEKQAQLEQYRSAKDAEVNQTRNELQSYQRNLERQVTQLQDELEIQHRELTSDFEEASKKREHEFRAEMDQLKNSLHSSELQVKLLKKEVELASAARQTRNQELEQAEGTQHNLEKQLKRMEWDLEETKSLKDARISDLEDNLKRSEQSLKRQQEEFIRKHAELDKMLRRKDTEFASARQSWQEREHHLLDEIRIIRENLEESGIMIRHLEWNFKDAVKEKNNIIERLEAEIAEIKEQWEHHVTEMSRDTVSHDVQLNALKEAESSLRYELLQKNQDIERYKKDLAESVERELALERVKAQVELDWQRRCDDLESLVYQKSEDLIRSLTKARDEALANLEEQKSQKEHLEEEIELLRQEQNQTNVEFSRHGSSTLWKRIPEDDQAQDSVMDDVVKLREQNKTLHEVVKQMQSVIESQANALENGKTSSECGNKDYVMSLEENLETVKTKYRQLELKVHDLETTGLASAQMPTDGTSDHHPVHDNALINSHIEQLNGTIGMLRSEKVKLTAQLRKLETANHHLQGAVDQLSKQPREKENQINQLQYELNACKRRNDAEVQSLRQRISDLELQVTEARKEADEYYRASTESNAEVTALSNQVSQLKLDLAAANPTVNFGAQELVIQQLQDIIAQRGSQVLAMVDGLGHVAGSNEDLPNVYKEKLKMAVKDMIKIAQENKLLTDINNRLRAELIKHGIMPPSLMKHQNITVTADQQVKASVTVNDNRRQQQMSSELNKLMQNKLQQLEELQYQITKQQLAMKGQEQIVQVKETEETYNDDFKPQSILKNSFSHQSSPSRLVNSPRGGSVREQGIFLTSQSSYEGESLREIWKLLDSNQPDSLECPSPDVTGQNLPSKQCTGTRSADRWTVIGSQSQMAHKTNNVNIKRNKLSVKASGKVKPKTNSSKPSVQTYIKKFGTNPTG